MTDIGPNFSASGYSKLMRCKTVSRCFSTSLSTEVLVIDGTERIVTGLNCSSVNVAGRL